MKHLRNITTAQPARAAVWQDIICEFAGILSGLLAAFGGASPFTDYIDEKCLIPQPNPDPTEGN